MIGVGMSPFYGFPETDIFFIRLGVMAAGSFEDCYNEAMRISDKLEVAVCYQWFGLAIIIPIRCDLSWEQAEENINTILEREDNETDWRAFHKIERGYIAHSSTKSTFRLENNFDCKF